MKIGMKVGRSFQKERVLNLGKGDGVLEPKGGLIF